MRRERCTGSGEPNIARQPINAENRTLTQQSSGPAVELIAQLLRNVHTVKGDARTHGLGNLTNTVHKAEQTYDDLRKGRNTEWEPNALLAQLDQVRGLSDEYAKINDTELGRNGPARRGSLEIALPANFAMSSWRNRSCHSESLPKPH